MNLEGSSLALKNYSLFFNTHLILTAQSPEEIRAEIFVSLISLPEGPSSVSSAHISLCSPVRSDGVHLRLLLLSFCGPRLLDDAVGLG